MAKNEAWAVVSDGEDYVIPSTVAWYRRDSIAAYVALFSPLAVPDWPQRSTLWRWNWLRRRHGCAAKRIKITVIGE